MDSNRELFDKLAAKFLKTFNDEEDVIYKEVIDKISNEIFQQICIDIIKDNDIKYFPRPIDFERMELVIRNKGYGL